MSCVTRKEGEVDGESGIVWDTRFAQTMFVGKCERKRLLGRLGREWEDCIQIDLKPFKY
jgi:hypothetical protein